MLPQLLLPPRLSPWRIATVLALSATLLLCAIARANTITSENWSGYAAHKTGVSFTRASARWRQPAAVCTTGTPTYSAFWVGIGGYSLSSQALEQIGSELDCNTNGTQSLSAWYALVPAATRTIHAGDLIAASVSISGKRVTLKIADTTRHQAFTRTITDHKIDRSSAEWIAEAPTDCASSSSCETLALADFGAVDFADATATTTTGQTRSIFSSLWTSTKILLGYSKSGTTFVANTAKVRATPTVLPDIKGFRVSYSGANTTTDAGSTGTGSTGTGDSSSPNGPGTGDQAGPGAGSDPGDRGQGGGSQPLLARSASTRH